MGLSARASTPTGTQTVTRFVTDSKLYIAGYLLPLLFIMMKAAHFQVADLQFSQLIIDITSFIWPPFKAQFQYLATEDRALDAANYAILIGVLIAFCVVAAINAIAKFALQDLMLCDLEKTMFWQYACYVRRVFRGGFMEL
jgi:hypothetical protein